MTDDKIVIQRPDWDSYFLGIAQAVATRADCRTRRFGAVIVKNNRIVSTGYNGAAAGHPGCLDGNCPRAFLEHPIPYQSYDEGPGYCIAVHAEANALLYASRDQTEGATLYLWGSSGFEGPCVGCSRLILGAGIEHVIF